jgi:hypothetical protein
MKRSFFLVIFCCLFMCKLIHSRVASVGHKNPRMPHLAPAIVAPPSTGSFSIKDLKIKKSFYISVMRYILYKELVVVYEKLGDSKKLAKCTKRMNKYFNKLVKAYNKAKIKGKAVVLNGVLDNIKTNLSSILPLVGAGK